MNFKNISALFFTGAVLMTVFSCRSASDDWNSPRKIYDTLCGCKNKDGQTIDEGLKTWLRSRDIPAGNTDQVSTWLSANSQEFLSYIDSAFKSDEVYLAGISAAQDTLAAHGSSMETQGVTGELFSIRAKYPACLVALPYINAH